MEKRVRHEAQLYKGVITRSRQRTPKHLHVEVLGPRGQYVTLSSLTSLAAARKIAVNPVARTASSRKLALTVRVIATSSALRPPGCAAVYLMHGDLPYNS
jgi:hypothetical protein